MQAYSDPKRASDPYFVQVLRDRGFDLAEAVPFEHRWRIRCSQCEALVVNGIATHERGCPNVPRDCNEWED